MTAHAYIQPYCFVSEHARRHGVTPVITFDQPLWWKALMIINSEPMESDLKRIVLLLGGFHAEMTFLGCIGHLMMASGLEEVMKLIYARNAVIHMFSGKAIARAIRAQLIVGAAINVLLLTNVLSAPLPCLGETSEENANEDLNFEATARPLHDQHIDLSNNTDFNEACNLYENLMAGTLSVEEVCKSDVLKRIRYHL